MRQVFDQLDPVAATPQVDKTYLVGERVVEHLRQSRVFGIPEGSVIEGQPLVLDGDDDPPGAAEDLDVVAAFLICFEGVLDDVAADRLDCPVQPLGGSVPQSEPVSHPPHEVHHDRQQPRVGRNRDAGDGSLQRRTLIRQRQHLPSPHS